MKKILVLLLMITMAISISSCSGKKDDMSSEPMITGVYVPGQTETAYAYVHGGYVGMAKVTTDDNGDLTVFLDEAFLPHVTAGVELGGDWTEDNTVTFDSHGPAYAAKYVEYNGQVYVGVETGSAFSYVEADEAGMPAGNTDLEKAIIKNQSTMAAYFALLASGGFKTYTEFGGKATPVTTTSNGGLFKKTAPGYWGPTETRTRTWMSNMKEIEDFIAENGLQFNESDMIKATEENADGAKVWSVADAVTGATNSDFKDYIGVAQRAAGKLKTN
jgi:hypothetical protein